MEKTAKTAGMDQKTSQQLYLMLTASQEELFQLLQEQRGEPLLAALRNPALEENHVLALLKRRGLQPEVFNMIAGQKHLADSRSIKLALVCHPETPSNIVATALSQLMVFELLKVTILPGVSPDSRLAAERAIIQRLPGQPLGNKLTMARRATAAVVEALLREGQPQVVEACLENPRLKEGAVHQFLSSAAATAETISMVGRSRWKGRPNIRLAILRNPRTPQIWFTLFLPGLPAATRRDLIASPRLTAAQKELVRHAERGSSC